MSNGSAATGVKSVKYEPPGGSRPGVNVGPIMGNLLSELIEHGGIADNSFEVV